MSDSAPSIAEEVKKDAAKNPKEEADAVPGVRGTQGNDKGKESDGAPSPTNWSRFTGHKPQPPGGSTR